MFHMLRVAVLAAGLGFCTVSAAFATPAPSSAEASTKARLEAAAQSQAAAEASFMAALHPKTGNVTLTEADATLALGDKYYFLDAADARKVIVDAWGNPPSAAEDVVGMIIPAGRTPFNDWGAVVSFEKSGYVSDKDASTTHYDDYLKEIQKGEADDNKAREKAGYEPMHLVGWAQPPSYDATHHYMIWAQDIRFGDSKVHSLNYDIRILGRGGVLSLNMIASLPELESIRTQARQLALAGQYNAGARYADYKDGDATAAYGVGGLVAAGLGLAAAKKLGLMGLLLTFGKKFVVFILAGLGILWRGLLSLFGKKSSAAPVERVSFETEVPPALPSAEDAAIAEREPTVRKPGEE
jgi:uncharacterized membrane-anchored protein